jgi:hypothetical protein
LSFRLEVNGREIPFLMPIRSEAIRKLLAGRRRRCTSRSYDADQAERIAWRQIYRWIEAQLALVETGMVTLDEVFLPYFQVSATETIYQRLAAGNFKALPAPEEDA